MDLSRKLDLELPVLSKICDVLQGKMLPQDLISTVMTEPISPEFDREVKDKRVVKGAGPLHVKPQLLQQRNMALVRKFSIELDEEEEDEKKRKKEEAENPKSIALVMIEYQNEFAAEGGKMHNAVKESMASTVNISF